MDELFSSIKSLKGVGEKRAKCYEKMGINTVYDLICHFPKSYIDFTAPVEILEAVVGETSVIKATVTHKLPEQHIRRGLSVYKATATDGNADFTLVFYNNHYAFDALKVDAEYFFYGRVSGGFLRREMNSPQVLPAGISDLLQPIYALTDGLTGAMVITNVKQALENFDENGYETLPQVFLGKYDIPTLAFAFQNIHFPKDNFALEMAKKRLAFEELFTLQLGMLLLKGRNTALCGCQMKNFDLAEFYDSLPFLLTTAQKNAVLEIISDMQQQIPMNRLLQGDVGSGKTAVAAAACYFSHKNGYQSALMAPTEILANQHFRTLSQFLEPLNVKICLLTGSLSQKNKAEVKRGIANGEFSVVVGTHALVQQSTEFQNLGLVITDEQHRFGVNQRATLAEKGGNPHKLVMSATPIPRTLGLIIYGDLEISVLNELPQGRLPIDTFAVGGKIRERAYNFIKKHLDEGRQAYIVCPMIEDGDAGLIAVNSYSAALSEGAFKGYSVGLLHGKMKSDEKNRVMAAFKDGEIQLLVSTTVVEVGVDVPNAIVMLVENADRFGLSQLHQLRGRVGRGEFKSYCILVTDNFSPEVKERLTTLTKISDGFKISEEDLRIRGCGDFFGERQHGLPPLKIAQFDAEMLSVTQTAAKELLAECPDLSAFPALKSAVERLFDGNGENGLN